MRFYTQRVPSSIVQQLDRGFADFFRGLTPNESTCASDPRTTVLEFDDRYEVEIDVPGVPSEAVSLEMEDGVLKVVGKRPVPEVEASVKVIADERSRAEFCRTVQLEKDIETEQIDAELNAGVLRIRLPKRTEAQSRKIEIRRVGGVHTNQQS
jgi:HSP20 family protein